MAEIKYTSLLRSTAADGKLAKTDQLYDENQKKFQSAINSELSSKVNTLGAVYRVKGTKTTYSEVLALTDAKAGDVWNISQEFTHSGKPYPGGTNVVCVEDTSASDHDASHWDPLGGIVDLSPYLPKADAVGRKGTGQDAEVFNDYEGNVAVGSYSHAEGTATRADGHASHAEGLHTQAANDGEHAEGEYNASHNGTRHSVGIGTSDSARKNAVEVMDDGRYFLHGTGGYDGTNPDGAQTLQEVIADKLNAYVFPNSVLSLVRGMTQEQYESVLGTVAEFKAAYNAGKAFFNWDNEAPVNYYASSKRVCLCLVNRVIDDEYDIFVLDREGFTIVGVASADGTSWVGGGVSEYRSFLTNFSVVDALTSTEKTKVLSAAQGKVLNDKLEGKLDSATASDTYARKAELEGKLDKSAAMVTYATKAELDPYMTTASAQSQFATKAELEGKLVIK